MKKSLAACMVALAVLASGCGPSAAEAEEAIRVAWVDETRLHMNTVADFSELTGSAAINTMYGAIPFENFMTVKGQMVESLRESHEAYERLPAPESMAGNREAIVLGSNALLVWADDMEVCLADVWLNNGYYDTCFDTHGDLNTIMTGLVNAYGNVVEGNVS